MSAWEPSVGGSDEYYTPAYVFEALGCRFDLDVASPPIETLVPADRVITEVSLESNWSGFVWMNPPFGGRNGVEPWLEKFFEHGDGVALTPDRTSAPWFHLAWSKADLVMFMPKISFHRADWSLATQPGTGSALWAAGGRAIAALINASNGGYGILATPLNRHEAHKVKTYKQRLKDEAKAQRERRAA